MEAVLGIVKKCGLQVKGMIETNFIRDILYNPLLEP